MEDRIYPIETWITLREDLKNLGLKKGAVGRVTQVDPDSRIYTVTFKNFQGESKAWARLREDQIRPV